MRNQVLFTDAINVFRQFNGVYLNFFTAAVPFFTVKESHDMAVEAVKKYNASIDSDWTPANDMANFTETAIGWVLEYRSNSGKDYRMTVNSECTPGNVIVEYDKNSSFAPEFDAISEYSEA